MESLASKVVVITGGASGIGLAMARRFGSEGARVVLADISLEALDVVSSELSSQGVEVMAVPTDVSDARAVEELGRRVIERFGAVNVVCNNAGIVVTGRAWEVPNTDWNAIVGVNFFGVVHGIATFVPLILATGEPGYVVNTASMAGVISLALLGPYVATKHAVVALSEVLDADLKQIGAPVGVSVVCPGLVATHIGQADKLGPVGISGPGVQSADQVADTIRAAMTERRFYVFTHSGSQSQVEARMTGILDGRAPFHVPLPTQ